MFPGYCFDDDNNNNNNKGKISPLYLRVLIIYLTSSGVSTIHHFGRKMGSSKMCQTEVLGTTPGVHQ